MKFSVWPNSSHPPSAQILELARIADAEGWHCLWFADHYMPNTGTESDHGRVTVHECWAMLPAIAAVTRTPADRLTGLADVDPPSGGPRQPGRDDRPHLRRPARARHRRRLADQRASRLRHRTGGAGHPGRPIRGVDPDRPQPAVRGADLVRRNGTTRSPTRRWTRSRCSHRCRSWSARRVRGCCGSPPRHADAWNTWGAPELAGANMAKLRTQPASGSNAILPRCTPAPRPW